MIWSLRRTIWEASDMSRRRLTAGAAGLCITLIGLGGLLALRAHPTGPILAAVSIGNGAGLGVWLPIDARAGRAYVLDDGVADRTVTVDTSGGYSWPPYGPLNTSVHVIDTRSGRLLAALPVADSTENVFVDAYTQRLFVFDPSDSQMQVYDTRRERLVGSLPWKSKVGIDTLLVDPRRGHIFITTHQWSKPAPQHVLLLDGSTGHVLRSIAFPHGPRVTELPSNSSVGSVQPSVYFPPSLSMALAESAGRLYVFDNYGRMSVLDSVSGRLLYTRQLRLAGAQVDEGTGHIFAFDASRNPATKNWTIAQGQHTPPHPGTVLMLDPRDGAVLRRVPGGTTRSGAESLAIDQGTNHVLIANWLNGTVSVLDGASGTLLRTVALGGTPYDMALDERHHRAAFRIGAGYSIAVVDTRNGRLLRTITLPWAADSMAVDPSSGRILVTTSALLPLPGDRWGWLPSWLRDHLPGLPSPAPTPDPSQRLLRHTVITLDPAR